MTFWGATEHFSGENGALMWSILVGKQKHNVQRPTPGWDIFVLYCSHCFQHYLLGEVTKFFYQSD